MILRNYKCKYDTLLHVSTTHYIKFVHVIYDAILIIIQLCVNETTTRRMLSNRFTVVVVY